MLYDTEVIDGENIDAVWFQRPISQTFLYWVSGGHRLNLGYAVKQESETNLNQSNMLDYPREHTATRLGFKLDASATQAEIDEIVINGIFVFSLDVWSENHKRSAFNKQLLEFENGFWALEAPIEIKPGDAFSVKILWKNRPRLTRQIRISCVIDGWEHAIKDVDIPAEENKIGPTSIDITAKPLIEGGHALAVENVHVTFDRPLPNDEMNRGCLVIAMNGYRPFLSIPLNLMKKNVDGSLGAGLLSPLGGAAFAVQGKITSRIRLGDSADLTSPFSIRVNGVMYRQGTQK